MLIYSYDHQCHVVSDQDLGDLESSHWSDMKPTLTPWTSHVHQKKNLLGSSFFRSDLIARHTNNVSVEMQL